MGTLFYGFRVFGVDSTQAQDLPLQGYDVGFTSAGEETHVHASSFISDHAKDLAQELPAGFFRGKVGDMTRLQSARACLRDAGFKCGDIRWYLARDTRVADTMELPAVVTALTHIETPASTALEWESEDEETTVTMMCGATALVYQDGGSDPPSFDFYMWKSGPDNMAHWQATCPSCLSAALMLDPVSWPYSDAGEFNGE